MRWTLSVYKTNFNNSHVGTMLIQFLDYEKITHTNKYT